MDCISKIVVFDLDETLGYFVEFGMFWDALKEYLKYIKTQKTLNQQNFNELLDLFPEFQRPKILSILNYLKEKKKEYKCNQIMIYTNNQGPKIWAEHIKHYFESKMNYKLFDQIIAAFKVNGKMIEICRTTNSKTYTDLIRCTKIPENTQICFLDDTFYPEMSNENVYYINIKPYVFNLPFKIMIQRLLDSGILKEELQNSIELEEFMEKYMNSYVFDYIAKTKQELTIDKILSKKILEHLHRFFQERGSTTTRKKYVTQNKSTKKVKKK